MKKLKTRIIIDECAIKNHRNGNIKIKKDRNLLYNYENTSVF